MTPQFKNLLLFLALIGLGVVTFLLLVSSSTFGDPINAFISHFILHSF